MHPCPVHDWTCRGQRLQLGTQTRIMGVVNVTPDSFSDGGKYVSPDMAVAHGLKLVEEGADLLDIGGESTRPGACPVDPAEEVRRILPVVRGLVECCPGVLLSVDTRHAGTAGAALEAGAHIVNDVTAGRHDPRMLPLVAQRGAGLVLMHMQGEPRTMQEAPHYDDVVSEVIAFLRERRDAAIAAGVTPAQIVLDPGIGFGKSLEHNLDLLAALPTFQTLHAPLLVGVSRKRMVGSVTGREVSDRLAGSLAGLTVCIERGVHLLRVHDVKESCDAARVVDIVRKTERARMAARNGIP